MKRRRGQWKGVPLIRRPDTKQAATRGVCFDAVCCGAAAAHLNAFSQPSPLQHPVDAIVAALRKNGGVIVEDLLDATTLARFNAEPDPLLENAKIGPREHLNDVLILASSTRGGAEAFTGNAASFARWVRLLRRMGSPARVRGLKRDVHLD